MKPHRSFRLPWAGRLLLFLQGLALVSSAAAQTTTYKTGDIVTTNFAFVNRFQWTNEVGKIFYPSNMFLQLRDFEGKIVFFVFFDVW